MDHTVGLPAFFQFAHNSSLMGSAPAASVWRYRPW
jgi:hypothetical protein